MMGQTIERTETGRRQFLIWAGAGALAVSLTPFAAEATPESVLEAMKKLIGDKEPVDGPFNIALPEIAENGAVVPLTVGIDNPMTADDHVTAIHIFADGNQRPDVATYRLGAHNGKAEISLRIRLLKTQKIVFVAETNKGQAYIARRAVKVTLGGCGG